MEEDESNLTLKTHRLRKKDSPLSLFSGKLHEHLGDIFQINLSPIHRKETFQLISLG